MNRDKNVPEHRCVACGGSEVCFGYLGTGGQSFIPSGIFTMAGYSTRAYVCLHCGFVHQYLPPDKLASLKNKLTDR